MSVWNLMQLASNQFKLKIIRNLSSTKVATGTYNPRQNPKVYGHLHAIERQTRVMEGGRGNNRSNSQIWSNCVFFPRSLPSLIDCCDITPLVNFDKELKKKKQMLSGAMIRKVSQTMILKGGGKSNHPISLIRAVRKSSIIGNLNYLEKPHRTLKYLCSTASNIFCQKK